MPSTQSPPLARPCLARPSGSGTSGSLTGARRTPPSQGRPGIPNPIWVAGGVGGGRPPAGPSRPALPPVLHPPTRPEGAPGPARLRVLTAPPLACTKQARAAWSCLHQSLGPLVWMLSSQGAPLVLRRGEGCPDHPLPQTPFSSDQGGSLGPPPPGNQTIFWYFALRKIPTQFLVFFKAPNFFPSVLPGFCCCFFCT